MKYGKWLFGLAVQILGWNLLMKLLGVPLMSLIGWKAVGCVIIITVGIMLMRVKW